MFHRNRLINSSISFVFLFGVASCDLGSGCGCGVQPLPPGGLPADQTIEGGAQLRVTQSGFSKITSLIPTVVNDALAGGFCIPRDQVVDAGVAEATICGNAAGGCAPGCPVSVTLDSSNIAAAGQNLNIQLTLDVHADVFIDYEVLWVFSGTCDADFDLNDGFVDIDVAFGIDPATGELIIEPASINTLDISGISVSGDCGAIDNIVDAALNLFAGLLNSFLGGLILDLVQPLINDLLQGLLPDPLGIEGLVDVGSLIGMTAPGTNVNMEMRMVPGGFVEVINDGLTLGMVMGVNSDEDVETRAPELDNEPAFCVPPVAAPNFIDGPQPLPVSARGTHILAAADDFQGVPEPDADMAIGVSETTLDLLGHHAFASGALCLGVGPGLVPQLNLGLIGILVPSFAELGSADGTDPLLLVTRPVQALDFTIGDGTESSPSLTIHIQEFEIDFYAFIFERYVRGFTVRLGLDVGINVEFTLDENGAPAILPVLTGLDTNAIEVTALNTEFLRESEDDLAATLPSILDLALPLLTDALGAIALPDVAGFTLSDLNMARVTTSEDEFLAITASLDTAGPMMAKLAERYPSVQKLVEQKDAQPLRAITEATLRSVNTPAPEQVRAAIRNQPGGAMPEVVIDVEPRDALGRELEWTWNINGGMWRPFTRATPLVIDTPAFAWQSEYTIEVAARVVGDYRTMDLTPARFPVTIDSVGPAIHADQTRLDGTGLIVPATDLVSPQEAVFMAFGHPADDQPGTDWLPVAEARLSLDDARALGHDGKVVVYARDGIGNISDTLLDIGSWLPFHGSGGGAGGCGGCASGGTDNNSLGGSLLLALLALTALAARGRRRRLRRAFMSGWRALRTPVTGLALALAISAFPACDCGGVEVPTCALDEECDDFCGDGFLGVCLSAMCLCDTDVDWGRFGQYSDMALSPNGGVWVSAYNSTHGDLTIARMEGSGPIPDETWMYVDGVPEGPVVKPRSERRGGIEASGPNVGKYTSIAVNQLDEVMVSHFDEDEGSLRLTTNFGGQWQSHVVSQGNVPNDPELGYAILGQYSSLTLDALSGRPGIAYFAHIRENDEVRTEVHYIEANTATPQGPEDWDEPKIAESAIVPDTGGEDPLSIPFGVGLFIDSARQTDGTPLVVYYDRLQGDLKLARFNFAGDVFDPPTILAGDDGSDAGWYPSVAVDANNDAHVSYVDASNDDLMYINTIDLNPELVDDGYRLVGTTEDGLPKPEFHLVGDDSNMMLTPLGPVIVYQDATSHELLRSNKNVSGFWQFTKVAGNEPEFAGGYGFYASAAFDGGDVVISSWVIDQPQSRVWVEVFREFLVVE